MILLTGASGYLGQQVADRLRAHELPFSEVAGPLSESGCDLANEAQCRLLLEDVRPTLVIHCAAIVPKNAMEYDDAGGGLASARMVMYLAQQVAAPIVFASSMTAEKPATAYAKYKRIAEIACRATDVILRLPGLFGLPRRSGVIYEAALKGEIRDTYGPYPAMHVQDAAEYLVRAATMPSDGDPEPYEVTYGNTRLERVYGSLGVTFQQRVQELVEQCRAPS